MKFRLSTLFVVVLVCALLLTAGLYVIQERRASLRRLQEAEAMKQAALLNQLELASELSWYRRFLGTPTDGRENDESHVIFLPLPELLGGGLHYGMPWTWRWKFWLAQVDDLEICIATNQIPETGFPLDEAAIFTSRVTDPTNTRSAGWLAYGGKAWDPTQPAEVVLLLRLDKSNSQGVINLNYLVYQNPNRHLLIETPAYVSTVFSFPIDADAGLLDPTLSGSGRTLSGLSIQTFELPLVDQSYNFEEPLELLRWRSKKQVGEHNFQPVTRETSGLLIWIRKSSLNSSLEE